MAAESKRSIENELVEREEAKTVYEEQAQIVGTVPPSPHSMGTAEAADRPYPLTSPTRGYLIAGGAGVRIPGGPTYSARALVLVNSAYRTGVARSVDGKHVTPVSDDLRLANAPCVSALLKEAVTRSKSLFELPVNAHGALLRQVLLWPLWLCSFLATVPFALCG
ncbi:hypothetical protein FISHEDRAFT_61643 [Fistulina hepatica ATCC 64428]|uniref:Uncharacterized protein n=1 Tax=Fistulina hepatica ATCC 64428 TaxID=1128425 RepID=A0A0D7A210_9AGAR|nr:hypothetical protein FISHEDRAFT_61643 [Fistulina hepatica ATCC 64428]